MKIQHLIVAPFVLALGFAFGCGGDPPSTACEYNIAGTMSCTEITVPDDSDATQDDLDQACTSTTGTVKDSCPSAGKVGCCATSLQGYDFNQCYYSGTADQLQTACEAGGGKFSK
jgi:hypothetical protein